MALFGIQQKSKYGLWYRLPSNVALVTWIFSRYDRQLRAGTHNKWEEWKGPNSIRLYSLNPAMVGTHVIFSSGSLSNLQTSTGVAPHFGYQTHQINHDKSLGVHMRKCIFHQLGRISAQGWKGLRTQIRTLERAVQYNWLVAIPSHQEGNARDGLDTRRVAGARHVTRRSCNVGEVLSTSGVADARDHV